MHLRKHNVSSSTLNPILWSPKPRAVFSEPPRRSGRKLNHKAAMQLKSASKIRENTPT